MAIDGRIGLGGCQWKEDIVVFSYILLSLPVVLVSWVSEHRECECVVEEKFSPLLCDRLVLLFALAFIVSFHTRSLAAVIRSSTIAEL